VIGGDDVGAMMAKLSTKGVLTPAETVKLQTFIMMLWNQVYAAYVQRKRGLITDEEFVLTERTIAFIITVLLGYGDASFEEPTFGPRMFGEEFYRWAHETRQKLESQGLLPTRE
jgi:hypothetical protein